MSIFFDRILQISENKGFKNITDFAKNGLNWDSSEKINRLKRENNKPSIDILIEISNKFDDVNLHWVITGKGEMLKSDVDIVKSEEISINDKNILLDMNEKIDFIYKVTMNEVARKELENLNDAIEQAKQKKDK